MKKRKYILLVILIFDFLIWLQLKENIRIAVVLADFASKDLLKMLEDGSMFALGPYLIFIISSISLMLLIYYTFVSFTKKDCT